MPNPKSIKTNPNHFIGQAQAATGEIIYLHMELITAENKPHWDQYIKASREMGPCIRWSGPFIGILSEVIGSARKLKTPDGMRYVNGDFFSYDKTYFPSRTGYTWDEFNAFINDLGQKGFIDTYKRKVLKKYSRI